MRLREREAKAVIEVNVCFMGSRSSPPPVTPFPVPSQEDLGMAEAHGGRVPVPALAQLVIQYIQGVLAVHSSDLDKAHHAQNAGLASWVLRVGGAGGVGGRAWLRFRSVSQNGTLRWRSSHCTGCLIQSTHVL